MCPLERRESGHRKEVPPHVWQEVTCSGHGVTGVSVWNRVLWLLAVLLPTVPRSLGPWLYGEGTASQP